METNQHSGGMKLKGKYFIKLYGPDGQLKDERIGYNVICTDGKEMLAAFLASAAASATKWDTHHMAVGTGTGAEDAANTALGTEVVRTTATATYTSGAIVEFKATFTTGTAAGAITEYGLLSSSTGGTLLSRDKEDVINVGADDTLTVTAQITLS
jgi:hypothetical protein